MTDQVAGLHQLLLQPRTRHRRARPGPLRPLRRYDPPRAARRRRPARPDLSRPGRIRIPSAGRLPRRRRGMWQFMGSRAQRATDWSAAGGSTTARIPKKPPAPPPTTCTTSTTSSETGIWPWPPTTPVPAPCRARSSAPATPISGSSTAATCCPRKRATTFPSSWPSPSWPRIRRSTAGFGGQRKAGSLRHGQD
jgi:hypothetical protein